MEGSKIKIAMVGLDLTSMDDVIIAYLPILIQSLDLEKVVFVHVARQLELPEELIKKYPDLIAPLDESITEDIRKKVAPIMDRTNTSFDIIVREGLPLERFLRIARIKNVDLIVMGRKREQDGSGLLSGHIIRKSPSSIFLVTENYRSKIQSIVVPVDFSSHAANSLELANNMKLPEGAIISCSHIYTIPTGYYKTGKNREEFAQIMRIHAQSDYSRFCQSNKLKESLSCDFILNENESISKLIFDNAKHQGADLLIIGSRGRTTASTLLIGSVVEKLVSENAEIPTLILKKKGESMGFFEALMNI
jgi:nucleotide-binding universal stress UspA family protein